MKNIEPYELIRSRRRTLALEVTGDGRLLVRAPLRCSQGRIDAFVGAHAAWIEKHVALQRERAARRPPAPTAAEIEALKARARAELPEKIARWSEKMGVAPTGFKVTAARKRYGSCNAKNGLCFSCFLMNCPEPAVELVVVHELCHIREKNHGPRFYALLARYLPDWRERKALLSMDRISIGRTDMEKRNLLDLLKGNPYPGRGIVLGKSGDGKSAVVVYFIMGRSENSRNRVFVPTEDGIRTEAHDPARMTDPSLIIYHPVRKAGRGLIVTNGDQTDTVRDYILAGRTFAEALKSRTFEPDGPNWTPRISGLLSPDGSFQLSILKSAEGNPDCCCRYFYHYDAPLPGEGRFLHTYRGDGNPLPSFEGEPERVALDAKTPETLAGQVWEALDPENKVSLFVRFVDLADGTCRDVLRNRH